MTTLHTRESRPGAEAAVSSDRVGTGSAASLPAGMTWDEIAAHVDGTFVLVVKVTGGRYRRRTFLTAKAAQDAARRAQARGENAVVILAELRPVYRVIGGGPRG